MKGNLKKIMSLVEMTSFRNVISIKDPETEIIILRKFILLNSWYNAQPFRRSTNCDLQIIVI